MIDSYKMYYSRRIQVVVILFSVTIATADITIPTYVWTDETGNSLTCQKCPPGTYVSAHCTSEQDTVCQPCPENHYTKYWNYLDKCRFCNVICQEGQQIKHQCNATHNRVCECQPGYHHHGDYCVKVVQCNFQDTVQVKGEECDKLIIEYFASLNITPAIFRQLEYAISNQKGKKPISQRRIRNLLKEFKNNVPDSPLLPRLLDLLKETNMSNLERKLRNKFLQQEDS